MKKYILLTLLLVLIPLTVPAGIFDWFTPKPTNQQPTTLNQHDTDFYQQNQKMAWRKRMYVQSQNQAAAATMQEIAEKTKDATMQQTMSDRPQPVTQAINGGIMTTDPRQITTLANGELGLSQPVNHVTVLTVFTPPPLPELQNTKAIYDIQDHGKNIEIRVALPEQPTDNAIQVVNNTIQSGQTTAQQVLGVEQFKVQQNRELEERRLMEERNTRVMWLIFGLVLAVIFGIKRLVSGANLFRDKSLDIQQHISELRRAEDHFVSTVLDEKVAK